MGNKEIKYLSLYYEPPLLCSSNERLHQNKCKKISDPSIWERLFLCSGSSSGSYTPASQLQNLGIVID